MLQERASVNLHTPACNVPHDMENRAIQPCAFAPGTPSLLRQPSPLKDLWARSQLAALGQASPAMSKAELPSPSPLKMHLFGNLPHFVANSFCRFLIGRTLISTFATFAGSQLPQSRLPMPKSWLLSTQTFTCMCVSRYH